MARMETWFEQDLKKPLNVRMLTGNLFSMDNEGNLIGVTVLDGGQPAELAGDVSANVIRCDGGTVAVTGTLEDNKAYIILPQAAYAVPGLVTIIIKLTDSDSGVITTLAAMTAIVYRSSTETVIDPGTIIPSIQTLISSIDTAVASIPADYSSLWTTLAPAFSSSTAYAAGKYVTYDGKMYRFIADHAAGTWASGDVTQADIGTDTYAIKSGAYSAGESVRNATGAAFGNEIIPLNISGYYGTGSVGSVSSGHHDHSNYVYAKVPCQPGDVFNIKIDGGTGAQRAYAFLGSDDTILSRAGTYASGEATITAPNNAAFVVFNQMLSTSRTGFYVYKGSTSLKALFENEMNLGNWFQLYSTDDVDSVVKSGWYRWGDGSENVPANAPDTGAGRMIVMYSGPTHITQMYFPLAKKHVKWRYKSSSWSEWKTLAHTDELGNISSSVYNAVESVTGCKFFVFEDGIFETKAVGESISLTRVSSTTGRVSAIEDIVEGDNIIINVSAATSSYHTYAITDSTGVVLERGGTSAGQFNIVAPENAAKIVVNTSPSYSGYYGVILKNETQPITVVDSLNVGMFNKIGICGYSWDSGYAYSNYTGTSHAYTRRSRSWGAVLANMYGIDCACYGVPSGTTCAPDSSWIGTSGAVCWQTATHGLPKLLNDTACDLYWFHMFGNDWKKLGSTYIGTIDDIKEDYTQNPDTFYGNYGRIMAQIKAHAPNAKFIFTYRTTESSTSTALAFRDALIEIAEHYSVPVINWYDDSWFFDWADSHLVSNHPTFADYAGMAKAADRLFSVCAKQNWNYFKDFVPAADPA